MRAFVRLRVHAPDLLLEPVLGPGDLIGRAYAEAIRERYRFLSYGDAMLLRLA
jgi:S-adenosylmethionine:tRNA-ribosyltransferase-isomerase (queuine synthetase)